MPHAGAARDGVIVSTDQYHYLAWKSIADELGIRFDERVNNHLRGVSRLESLDIVLENCHGSALSQEEKAALAEQKNDRYRQLLQEMSPASVSPAVRGTLKELRDRGCRLAIGSSSQNARTILKRVELLAAAMLMSLAACGGKPAAESGQPSEPAQTSAPSEETIEPSAETAPYLYEFEGMMGAEKAQFDLAADGTCQFSLPGNPMLTDVYAGTCTREGNTVLDSTDGLLGLGIKTKLNCVPLPGRGGRLMPLARFAMRGLDVRFIEVIPIGAEGYPAAPPSPRGWGQTATRW